MYSSSSSSKRVFCRKEHRRSFSSTYILASRSKPGAEQKFIDQNGRHTYVVVVVSGRRHRKRCKLPRDRVGLAGTPLSLAQCGRKNNPSFPVVVETLNNVVAHHYYYRHTKLRGCRHLAVGFARDTLFNVNVSARILCKSGRV